MQPTWRARRILDAAQRHGWAVTECSERVWSIYPKSATDPLDRRGFTVYAAGERVRVVRQSDWRMVSQRDVMAMLAWGSGD